MYSAHTPPPVTPLVMASFEEFTTKLDLALAYDKARENDEIPTAIAYSVQDSNISWRKAAVLMNLCKVADVAASAIADLRKNRNSVDERLFSMIRDDPAIAETFAASATKTAYHSNLPFCTPTYHQFGSYTANLLTTEETDVINKREAANVVNKREATKRQAAAEPAPAEPTPAAEPAPAAEPTTTD